MIGRVKLVLQTTCCIILLVHILNFLSANSSNIDNERYLPLTRRLGSTLCKDTQSNILRELGLKLSRVPRLISFYRSAEGICSERESVNGEPLVVPNIVHFIRFGEQLPFQFQHYISFKSVDKFIKPLFILVWGDHLPNDTNIWWKRTLKEVGNIYHVYHSRIPVLFGKQVLYPAHEADWLRLNILTNHGGIYLDGDVIVLKSFDSLRTHEMTLSRATNWSISNGILLSRRNAEFIRLWLKNYDTEYDPNCWACSSVMAANNLTEQFSDLVHIEHGTMVHPTFEQWQQLFAGEYYNLTNNYSIHIYNNKNWYRLPQDEQELAGYNCTVGRVMRYVLYDNDQLTDDKHAWNGYVGTRRERLDKRKEGSRLKQKQ